MAVTWNVHVGAVTPNASTQSVAAGTNAAPRPTARGPRPRGVGTIQIRQRHTAASEQNRYIHRFHGSMASIVARRAAPHQRLGTTFRGRRLPTGARGASLAAGQQQPAGQAQRVDEVAETL